MKPVIDIFHANVSEGDADRLLEVRQTAIAELQTRCPGLQRAELVRLTATTWIDLLVWESTAAAEQATEHFATIPALGEMHAIVGEPTAYERGTLEHQA